LYTGYCNRFTWHCSAVYCPATGKPGTSGFWPEQIPGSNNMIDYLHCLNSQDGEIEASRNWFPACSFLEDTAFSLYQLMEKFPGGLYHLDANPGLHFYEIVKKLSHLQHREWRVIATENPDMNNRMVDDRIQIKKIVDHFKDS